MDDHVEGHARQIRFTLNGRPAVARVESHHTVIDLLCRLDLFGARESCGQGLCGCCTVWLDDVAVSGCLTLAQLVEGRALTTVESLDASGTLSPVQQAFIDEGAFQCGFCTPGFIMMTHQLLAENPDPTDNEIAGYLAGNLCRCATYPEVIRAVKSAAARMHAASAA
ncbi:MAG TPA: (2Fe-2S)-binding protein [Ancylobacter sp.]